MLLMLFAAGEEKLNEMEAKSKFSRPYGKSTINSIVNYMKQIGARYFILIFQRLIGDFARNLSRY
jgi:hypothetical protein